MTEQLESKQQQLAVIEANANYLGAVAYKYYRQFQEKGTLVLLRQLENNGTDLEEWQLMYKPMSLIPLMLSDWKESGIQDMIIKYNPELAVVCTFLYPDGNHTTYLFEPSQPPSKLQEK